MSRRAGDLPAWVAVAAGLLVPILAAAAAWGATNARLEQHDAELRSINSTITDVDRRLARIEGRLVPR